MDITVLISWKSVPRSFGWTIGPCPYCNAVTAGRIDELIHQIDVCFIPVLSTVVGYQCKCDLCERPLADFLPEKRLSSGEWNHSLGLHQIATKLGLPSPPQTTEADVMIDSLLSSVTDSTTLNALDISFGLTTGGIIGAITGIGLGYVVLPKFLDQTDLFGCVFIGILGGLVLGGVIGASIAALTRRSSVPFQKINSAVEHYALDTSKLLQIAKRYPARIQNAALRVRDLAALNPQARMAQKRI